MQMWCLLIQMNISTNHIKLWIAKLKLFHIILQHPRCNLCRGTTYSGIIPIAYLNNNLIKQFFLFASGNLIIITFNLPVLAFLFCIVFLKRLVKQFMISLLNIFVDKRDIIIGTAGIYIVSYKSSCVVPDGTFPIHETDCCFHSQNSPLLVCI